MDKAGRKFRKHELKKIVNDVELVRKTAVVVIEIDGQDDVVICENCSDFNSRLGGTIAVIGPTRIDDLYFERAVLLEVGIGPSRPYKQGWISDGVNKRWFTERKKCFSITKGQYLVCAPIIFKYLQKIADKRVAQWKCNLDNPFFVPGTKKWWSHREKKMYVDKASIAITPATRFSVSIEDGLILSDIFWAELEGNATLKKYLKGLTGFIDKRLKRNRQEGYRDFSKLKAAEDARSALSRIPFYMKVEIMERFFEKTASRINTYNDLATMIGWDFSQTKERRLADAALPDCGQRVGEMQVRITGGLDNGKDYIVFEVAAKNKVEND